MLSGVAQAFTEKKEILYLGIRHDLELSFEPNDPSVPTYSAELVYDPSIIVPVYRIEEQSDHKTKYTFLPVWSVEMVGSDGSQVELDSPHYHFGIYLDKKGNFMGWWSMGTGIAGTPDLRCTLADSLRLMT